MAPTRGADMVTGPNFDSAENKEIDTSMTQGAADESQERTKNKPYCFRCLTKGHTAVNCQANILCDICGSEDHVTKACLPYKNLKFTAIPSGYAVKGLGFYNIPYLGSKKGDTTSTLAEITVLDGSMSATDVESELRRLVPGDWDWKVVNKGTSFYATFPSTNELNRLVEWGPVVANRVGSGVSRKVDLKFTREHKIARIKVGCLDPDLIPEFLSMLIGEHVYDLQFRAEKNIDPDNPVPIDMDLDPQEENGNGNS
ncbi:hypothetical protein BS78_K284800 [Paspalum vaginatum]|uniref:CCHC-type domain-containing protein n=1 Tax=Paspalum vaginatum TaxID=158149 RepID=A0A9W7X9P8_9POAL|nr:hypothetical protein BS78_K284800 [Paspalum vaginatum]